MPTTIPSTLRSQLQTYREAAFALAINVVKGQNVDQSAIEAACRNAEVSLDRFASWVETLASRKGFVDGHDVTSEQLAVDQAESDSAAAEQAHQAAINALAGLRDQVAAAERDLEAKRRSRSAAESSVVRAQDALNRKQEQLREALRRTGDEADWRQLTNL